MPQAIPAVIGGLGLLQQRKSGKDALKASERASQAANQGQADQLSYLQERNAMFDPYRMAGMEGLQQWTQDGGITAEQAMGMTQQSPVYQAIMAGKDRALDTVDARASMRGGLRSGNLVSDIFNTSQQIDANANLSGYQDILSRDWNNRSQQLSGLNSLMGVPNYDTQMAQSFNSQGFTAAQGIRDQAQTRQDGAANNMDALYGFGDAMTGFFDNRAANNVPAPVVNAGRQGGYYDDNLLDGYNPPKFSDIRLKKDIKFVGEQNGYNIYEWAWNKFGEALGLTGKARGVLAHEIFALQPKALDIDKGFLTVNYRTLGLTGG